MSSASHQVFLALLCFAFMSSCMCEQRLLDIEPVVVTTANDTLNGTNGTLTNATDTGNSTISGSSIDPNATNATNATTPSNTTASNTTTTTPTNSTPGSGSGSASSTNNTATYCAASTSQLSSTNLVCSNGQKANSNGVCPSSSCKSGYTKVGSQCEQNCPSGYKTNGNTCTKPASYKRTAYVNQAVCNKHNSQGCQKVGKYYFGKCKTNFKSSSNGFSCVAGCPSGFTATGNACRRPSYALASSGAKSCPRTTPVLHDGECYSYCSGSANYRSKTCVAACPSGYVSCGGTTCSSTSAGCGNASSMRNLAACPSN